MDSHPQSCQLESVEDRCGSTNATDRVSDANGSCLSAPESPTSTGKSTPHSATKGFGLRKWRRRLRRDDVATKEVEATVSSKPLKRGAPTTSLGANPPTDSTSADPRHITEDSVGSVKMPICSPGAIPEVDSKNCDDHLGRRSCTAASAPRSKEKKNKIKNNTSGKDIGAPVLRMPHGKGKLEGIKKARGGEGIKIETENSHSSMESDSRSSNFVFMQGACSSVSSNGNQSSRVPMSSTGENGDESLAEKQTIYNQGADGESEDYLRDNEATGHPTSDYDPLLESIRNLQSVHEVLETEVHRFGQLGRGNIGSRDFNTEVDEPSSSRQFDSQINGQSTSQEPQVAGLTEKIKMLEIRLEDAHNKLKAKEEPVDGDFAELENEVEDHYKQRIAAEVAYLVLAKFVQKLKVAAKDPFILLNQQKALAGEHVEVLDKLGKAEAKYYGDILQAEEVVKRERRRVRKVTTCLLIELILLVWVVWLLMMQLYPQSGIVVPT